MGTSMCRPGVPTKAAFVHLRPQQERTVRWVVISVREVSEHRQASAFHEQYAKQKHPQVQAAGVDRDYGRFNFSKRVFTIWLSGFSFNTISISAIARVLSPSFS